MLVQVDSLHVRKLQVFGNSRVVIDWINGSAGCQVRRLRPLMRQVREFIENMDWFNCKHILHDLNEEADILSKEALVLDEGDFVLQEFQDDQFISEYNIRL